MIRKRKKKKIVSGNSKITQTLKPPILSPTKTIHFAICLSVSVSKMIHVQKSAKVIFRMSASDNETAMTYCHPLPANNVCCGEMWLKKENNLFSFTCSFIFIRHCTACFKNLTKLSFGEFFHLNGHGGHLIERLTIRFLKGYCF